MQRRISHEKAAAEDPPDDTCISTVKKTKVMLLYNMEIIAQFQSWVSF